MANETVALRESDAVESRRLRKWLIANSILLTQLKKDLFDLDKPVPTRELLAAILEDTVYLMEELSNCRF